MSAPAGEPRPPRLPERLLRIVLPRGLVGESVRGDLLEEYGRRVRRRGRRAANGWYRRQSWSVALHAVRERVRRASRGGGWGRGPGSRTVHHRTGGGLLRDLSYAGRALRRNAGVTAVAVLSLALAIGANAVVFSFGNAFLLRPLPFQDPDRLVHVWSLDPHGESRVSPADFIDWQEGSGGLFRGLAAFNYTEEALTGGAVPERVSAGRVTAGTFQVLGVEPILGRGFAEGEDRPGAEPVVVLRERFWRERFGGDPDVLGRVLEVDGRPHVVVGVMPDGFVFPLPTTEFWIPRVLDPSDDRRDRRFLQVVGRLAHGVEPERAEAGMGALAARLAERHPATNAGFGVRLEPLRDALNFASDVVGPMAAILQAAVALVLLIACANVANLLLSQGVVRVRELAVRRALGASRRRVVRQLLTESGLMALAGGAAGVALAYGAASSLERVIPADLYRVGTVEVDGAVLGFSLVLSLLSALAFGLVPALRASDGDLARGLAEGGRRGTPASGRRRLNGLLVVIQVGASLALVVATALMGRSLLNLHRVDPGFRPDGVLTAKLQLGGERWSDPADIAAFEEALVERVGALPGAVAAATVNYLPLNHEWDEQEVVVEGAEPRETWPSALRLFVGGAYFEVLGIPLVRGRVFGPDDRSDTPLVAIVDQAAAARLRPDGNALGARIDPGIGRPATVVGVVGSTRQVELGRAGGVVYLSRAQLPGGYFRVLVRAGGDPLELGPSVRDAVAALEPDLPVTEVRTLASVVGEFLLPQRLLARMLALLAGGALLLACVGVYGMMAFFVSQRVRELGVRRALGATRRDVTRLVLGRTARTTGAGVALGLLAALLVGRGLTSFLFGVGSFDPATFAATAALLGGTAMLAGFLGARHAGRIEPVTALRLE